MSLYHNINDQTQMAKKENLKKSAKHGLLIKWINISPTRNTKKIAAKEENLEDTSWLT